MWGSIILDAKNKIKTSKSKIDIWEKSGDEKEG